MRGRRARALVLACAVLAGTPAAAGEVVRLSGDPWPPYVLGELGHEATGGLGVELIREVFRHLDGVQVSFPLEPWQRALDGVRSGGRDGIALLLRTPERESYMVFTRALLHSRSLVWYRKERFPRGLEWESIGDLLPYRIGVTRGYSYGDEVDHAIEAASARTTRAASVRQLFSMLASDRFDLALANDAVGAVMSKLVAPGVAIDAAGKATGEDVYHIGFSMRSEASRLVPQLDEIIERLRAQGVLDRIVAEYYATH